MLAGGRSAASVHPSLGCAAHRGTELSCPCCTARAHKHTELTLCTHAPHGCVHTGTQQTMNAALAVPMHALHQPCTHMHCTYPVHAYIAPSMHTRALH